VGATGKAGLSPSSMVENAGGSLCELLLHLLGECRACHFNIFLFCVHATSPRWLVAPCIL